MAKPALNPVQTGQDEAWPCFGEDEIAAVADVLRSGKVNQWTGTRVKQFEQALGERIGMPHRVALANGSVALELALRALGVGPGDEVIVSSSSFIASASCVPLVGATPVFADVDPDSQNISAATIEPLITEHTKAVIPVHLAGWPADMPGIMALAQSRGLVVIEDCAQSIGAAIQGQPAGSFGDASIFSFCQDKIITTGGEGGAALFRDKGAWQFAWEFKDHGKSFDLMQTPPSEPGFRFVHKGLGTNLRMTEMQAAIGLVQFGKLDGWLESRRKNAQTWRNAFEPRLALRQPTPPEGVTHANYKYSAFLEPERLKQGTTRDDVLAALHDGGIRALSGFCPEIYREEAFQDLAVETRETAHRLGQTSLAFEIHPTLDPRRLAERAQMASTIISRFESSP